MYNYIWVTVIFVNDFGVGYEHSWFSFVPRRWQRSMESEVTHGGLMVQKKLWAPACRVGESWGISIWLTIRIAIWPHQGRGTSAELVRRGLEFGHRSSEFVVKTWGGFPYWNSHQSMKKGIHTHEKWIPNTGWLTLTIIYISVISWFAPSTYGFLDFWWIQSPNTKDCATQHGATDVAWMS